MSENPEERNKDTKKAGKDNIEQLVDRQDPTEPVQLRGGKEGKGTAQAGGSL